MRTRNSARAFFEALAPLAIAAWLTLLARDACAEGTSIVQVRSTHAALDERIAAELSTLGYDVKSVDAPDGADLGAIARASGAAGAIRAFDGDGIELWVDPHRAGVAPFHERIALETRGDPNVTAVVALETMRAHLLAVRPPREPAPPPPPVAIEPATPAPPSSSSSSPAWLWAHAAIGAETSAGGLSPAANVLLELRVEPRGWLGAAAFGAFTPAITHVDAAEGEATLRRVLAGATADARWRVARATFSLGAGGAIAWLVLHGRAGASDYGGQDATSITAGPLVRAAGAMNLGSSLRARAAIASGVTFPRAVVSFAGREIADWGRPFALVTLGLEWGLAR